MKKVPFKKWIAWILALSLVLSLTACGGSSSSVESATGSASTSTATGNSSGDTGSTQTEGTVVNIGVNDNVKTLNPLRMDYSFVAQYAVAFSFLPLLQEDTTGELIPALAESITTEDNVTFHIKLRDDAYWSDGEPVTSDDVIFTFLKISSPIVANENFAFWGFKGFDESGFSPEGATEIEGLVRIDDKNLDLVAESELPLASVQNSYGRWINIIPYHVLGNLTDEELTNTDWFDHPDVVSGPYQVVDSDYDHYVSYVANENYFDGAPKIDNLNIKIIQSNELLVGLQTGDIDFILPSSATIPVEDRDAVESLETVDAIYADAITNELTTFNCTTVTDARVRQAFVYAIDRETIINNLLGGHAELHDGMISSVSPYFDADQENIPYDPERAKELLEEATADGAWDNHTINYYVSSSDSNIVRATALIEQNLEAVGFDVEVHTTDFASLWNYVGTEDCDVYSVQYTMQPTDYYSDENYLFGTGNTAGYSSQAAEDILAQFGGATTEEKIKQLYWDLDEVLVEDVPAFSMYFGMNLGVVSKRLKNATPSFYGALANVQDWEISE